jgi:hypothetical protein
MGAQLRSHIGAMDAVCLPHRVLDIFRHAARLDDEILLLVGEREIRLPPAGLRIFHVNADEVERVLDAFAACGGTFADGINVIVPAWELPRYPAAWLPGLRRFDEVWAISAHVQASLAGAGVDSHLIGQSVEPAGGALLPRRWFGIRESAFVLLGFLDTTSYVARKNPQGSLDLFARLRGARPWADLQLVLKAKNGDAAADAAGWAPGLKPGPHVVVLSEPLDSIATRSLISACDCFVSLHRAEGFGRGLGEAMALGRLALGTGWSGNLDFMDADHGLLAPFRRVPVPAGAYPHARGQRWAEPDIAAAADMLLPYIDHRERAVAAGARARARILATHGHRAVGLRILARVQALLDRLAGGRG